jgi:hypothetical protein
MATEKFVIQVCGWLIGIPLEILVIHALFRGPYRRYPMVFVYVLASLVTTLLEVPFNIQSWRAGDSGSRLLAAKIYWVDDWILQIVIFAMVLSLIDQAISKSAWRRLMRSGLAGGAILFASISLWIHYRPPPVKFGYWMTPWTRDLSVCATILDLTLWMILIASRKSDSRLLLISGAMGLRFTGDAIGEAVLSISTAQMMEALALAGAVIVMLADLACLYIWWQTFRRARSQAPLPAAP